MTRIGGRTRLAGVIGYPLDHTLSPVMHNAVYEALDLDWVYVPMPVASEDDLMRVIGAIKVLPFVGFNITMPYKHAMLSYCDEVAMLARMAGAVNAVHCVDGRLIGYNTDGRGLLESLADELDFDPAGKRITILGAGGAAGSAFVAFVLGKAAHISVVNRTTERAEELIERMRSHMHETEADVVPWGPQAQSAVAESDLVVNATPIGMATDDPSPVPSSWFRHGQVAVDMVYGSGMTAFRDAAQAAGAKAVDGLGMLVSQGAIAIDIWNDNAQARTPRDVMRRAAEAEQARVSIVRQGV